MEDNRAREGPWFAQYDKLKEYLEENEWEAPTKETNPELYNWLKWQRDSFKRTPDASHWVWKQELLAELGIDLVAIRKFSVWKQSMTLLKAHLQEYNGERPTQTTNAHLQKWLWEQRKRYKKAPDKSVWLSRVHLLAKMGIDITRSAWEDKITKPDQGQGLQPSNLGTAEDTSEGASLQGSISGLDQHNNILCTIPENSTNQEHASPLQADNSTDQCLVGLHPQDPNFPASPHIPMSSPTKSPRDVQWLNQLERLKTFINDNDGEAPSQKTSQSLYTWMNTQRKTFLNNPQEFPIWKKEMLESIGISLTSASTDTVWRKCYENLKEFMESNGRPTLQSNPRLYYWLIHQRKNYRLKPDKIHWKRRAALLAELGINITLSAVEEKSSEQSVRLQLLQNEGNNLNVTFGTRKEMQTFNLQAAEASEGGGESDGMTERPHLQDQGLKHSEDSLLPTPNNQVQLNDNGVVDQTKVDNPSTGDDKTIEILQRFNFWRRCCHYDWCAFKNIQTQRLSDSVEKALVPVILSFDSLSIDDKRELLSLWLVDQTRFQIKITATGHNLNLCYTALGRIFDLKDKVFIHVLKNSVGEIDCSIEAAKERLIKSFFVELERTLKSEQSASTLVVGRSQKAVYEEFSSYAASQDGPKHGCNYFSLFWRYHYPHIMSTFVLDSSSTQGSFSSKLSANPRIGLKATALLPGNIHFRRASGGKRTSGAMTGTPRSRHAESEVGEPRVKILRCTVSVTHTPYSTVRARRRKAGIVRKGTFYSVR